MLTLKYLHRSLFILIVLCEGPFLTEAQTGPAGVGNPSSNKVWLDASYITGLTSGAKISSWTDRSGNNWNANQNNTVNRPSYIANGLNGRPVINFSRASAFQFLEIRNVGIGVALSNSNTLFVVSKANSGSLNNTSSGNLQCVFDAEGHHSGIQYLGYPSTQNFFTTQWTGGSVPGAPTNQIEFYSPTSQGVWTIMNKICIENSNSTTLRGFKNGALAGTDYGTLPMTNYNNNLAVIGATAASGGYAWPLNGDIAEVIVFNTDLNDAQRIIVDNYLSAKYNLNISNDRYTLNAATFTLDVQGIGTYDGGSLNKHSMASNSKGLTLEESNSSLDAAGEFLFAGHASSDNTIVNVDLPQLVDERWERVWYLEKTGSLDAKFSFDVSDGGLTAPANLNIEFVNYKLLFRSTGTGSFSIVPLTPVLENGDQLAFTLTDSQLSNGYYTLGYSQSLVWTGEEDQQWNQASNWNLNRVPTAKDRVTVNSCTVCPALNSDVNVASFQLNPGSVISLSDYLLLVGGPTSMNESRIVSNQGKIQSADFIEIKNSTFEGSIILEKTGGSTNSCYGGNTFSPELKIVNSSNSSFSVATQASNIIH